MKTNNKIKFRDVFCGYTLLELLLALAVVSILSTLGISEYSAYITRSRWVSNFAALSPLKLAIAQCLQLNGGNSDLCNDFQKLGMMDMSSDGTYNIITPTGPLYLPYGTAMLSADASIVIHGDEWEGGNHWRLGRPACVVTLKPQLSVNAALYFTLSYPANNTVKMRCHQRYIGQHVVA